VYGDIAGNRGRSYREMYRFVQRPKAPDSLTIDLAQDYMISADSDDLMLHLYFIEPTAPAGRRIFDILVNGVVVRRHFDIAAEAGGVNFGYELKIELDSQVLQVGTLLLELRPFLGQPIIAGLQIRCKNLASHSSSSSSTSSSTSSSVSTSTSTSTSSSLYNRDWVPAGDIDIMLVDEEARTILYAEDDCIQRGGHLLVPHNEYEIEVMAGFYNFTDTAPIAWLGGTVTDNEEISWLDGTAYNATLTPWDDGYPMGTFRRGVFFSAKSGEADFRTKRMGLKLAYFCMRDMITTTTTTTTTMTDGSTCSNGGKVIIDALNPIGLSCAMNTDCPGTGECSTHSSVNICCTAATS
jgi:hypothetical protein